MPYDLSTKLVIGIASSALFDLREADKIFRENGEAEYRTYQRENLNNPLAKGVAFPFIKRILSLNSLNPENPLVEVILLSRNDPETGLRVFRSINHYNLNITRATFLQGKSPYPLIAPFKISLFLSANVDDVNQAIADGHPAGLVLPAETYNDMEDDELRIAFDFDGVLADDSAESINDNEGLAKFHQYEKEHALIPHSPGPLKPFLEKISAIQAVENERQKESSEYQTRLRISIVTARNAPAHERVITTLREWNIRVNEAYFLGGIEKTSVLDVIRPHIFFDDQIGHLKNAMGHLPSVHIPFGVKNKK